MGKTSITKEIVLSTAFLLKLINKMTLSHLKDLPVVYDGPSR